ncbi:aldehyde dehydrogenase family protein [Streptomyces sp. WMMC500]|uniref:aldehyde dehydrogenase family protein n=1 Tax=Streptomyces sp. WMMC500 TaxID=3015154 RepID=UPI00248CE956|nr:aldehyde dehydrogenase family protein [Streptomyces sp. WMMC500]WBB61915.1 aldehyde dehydrogenase family protein [Streptomyces sp. WMMC500]
MTSSFACLSPSSGEQVAEYPVATEAEVRTAVAGAREAAAGWRRAGPRGRRAALLAFKHALARETGELAGIIAAETGKPVHDARTEVVLTLHHLDWAGRNAHRVLRRRRVPSGALAVHERALVGHRPLGVIGVIGPWNYPLYTPMGAIGYALAAGNGVVVKPSELAPGAAVRLSRVFDAAVPAHAGLLRTVTGLARTGEALARAGVDKVAFTGSPSTARKVAAVCAETLTPVLVEGGGKDAAIVGPGLGPAALERAAEAIVWGAMSNAGQTCAGVERVYAVEEVHERLVQLITRRARRLEPGTSGRDVAPDYGAMTLPSQFGTVEYHVKEAVTAGARTPLGGPESVQPPYVRPVLLVDVPEDSPAMREETFGPVVAVNAVADLDEAVRRTNASPYALGAAVFTRTRREGLAVAARLRAGAVSVGSVLGYAGVPALPFGGSGLSGYGRIHGAEGLRAFAAPASVTVRRFHPYADLTSFATPRARAARAVEFARRLHALR